MIQDNKDYSQRCNILYKDIHPGNVCVDTDGHIYLIDFEVAFIPMG